MERTGPEVTRLTANLHFHMGFTGLSKCNLAIMAHSANMLLVILQIVIHIKELLNRENIEYFFVCKSRVQEISTLATSTSTSLASRSSPHCSFGPPTKESAVAGAGQKDLPGHAHGIGVHHTQPHDFLSKPAKLRRRLFIARRRLINTKRPMGELRASRIL